MNQKPLSRSHTTTKSQDRANQLSRHAFFHHCIWLQYRWPNHHTIRIEAEAEPIAAHWINACMQADKQHAVLPATSFSACAIALPALDRCCSIVAEWHACLGWSKEATKCNKWQFYTKGIMNIKGISEIICFIPFLSHLQWYPKTHDHIHNAPARRIPPEVFRLLCEQLHVKKQAFQDPK